MSSFLPNAELRIRLRPVYDFVANLSVRHMLWLLAGASLLALMSALAFEEGFGIVGCVLCVYQRIPFAVSAVCAVAGSLVRQSVGAHRFALAICGMAFAAGAGLAIYQVGLQQAWWADVGLCRSPLPDVSAGIDLRAAVLSQAARPPCDYVEWDLFGVSLAAFNALYSTGLALLCAATLIRSRSHD